MQDKLYNTILSDFIHSQVNIKWSDIDQEWCFDLWVNHPNFDRCYTADDISEWEDELSFHSRDIWDNKFITYFKDKYGIDDPNILNSFYFDFCRRVIDMLEEKESRTITESDNKTERFKQYIINDFIKNVVDFLVVEDDDSSWEYIETDFIFRVDEKDEPYGGTLSTIKSWLNSGMSPLGNSFDDMFVQEMETYYGISDFDTQDMLYNEIMYKVVDTATEMQRELEENYENLNESKVDRYHDYIIDDFIKNHIVETDDDDFNVLEYSEKYLAFALGFLRLNLKEPKLLHFATDLTIEEFMDGDFGLNVYTVFKEKYHIDNLEIVFDIWKKICSKLYSYYDSYNSHILESTDKIMRFHQVVIDDLINQTEIKGIDNILPSFDPLERRLDLNDIVDHPETDYGLGFYLKNNYGITGDEAYHIWDLYTDEIMNILSSKKSINESENKKERYIEYIKDQLKNSVEFFIGVDYSFDPEVEYLGCSFNFDIEMGKYDWDMLNDGEWDLELTEESTVSFDVGFIKLFNDQFGITDMEVINRFYFWFVDYIRNEFIKRGGGEETLNESEDKDKLYFDYIVDHFINNYIDIHTYDDEFTYGEFTMINPNNYYDYKDLTDYIMDPEIGMDPSFLDLMEVYGVTDYETKKELYVAILNKMRHILRNKPITESEDKLDKLKKFVLDDLVKGTMVSGLTHKYPWSKVSTSFSHRINEDGFVWSRITGFIEDERFEFHKICREKYGLNILESQEIFTDYISIIRSKMIGEINTL
jgi:hypothetical protein